LENEVRNEQVALVRAQAQLNVAKKKGDQAKISRLTQAVNDRQANIRAIESEMKR
jgi:putative periplasmic protein